MLAGVHHLVVPVRALHEPDDQRLLARGGRRPVEHLLELLRRLPQIRLDHDPGRRPLEQLRLVQELEHEPHRRLDRVHRLHVDVEVGAELLRAHEQRPHPARRVLAAHLRSLRAQQRRERRDLHGQVHPREAADRVRLEHRPLGPRRRGAGERLERVHAPVRVAVRLGLGDRGLAQQVERDRGAVVPQVADRLQSRLRALSDDEAVRHVADPGCGRRPQRRAARLCAGHLHRRLYRRRAVVHLLEVAGQVPRQVVQRAAGGGDVHEAKQRGAQLGVLRGQLHRALVDHAERMARASGESRVDRAPYLLKLGLHDSESYSPGYRPTMPSLVLGPVLRYVGETDAVLWVETDSACEVEILGTKERTFCVCGHHYALVCCGDLERGAWHEYEVHLDGERVWPRADGWPPSAFHTLSQGEPATGDVRLVPRGGAARAAVLAPQGRGRARPRGRRAAHARLRRCATSRARSGPTCC